MPVVYPWMKKIHVAGAGELLLFLLSCSSSSSSSFLLLLRETGESNRLNCVTELVKSFEDCSKSAASSSQPDMSYNCPAVTIAINPILAPFKSIRTSSSSAVDMSQFLPHPQYQRRFPPSHAELTSRMKTSVNSFLALGHHQFFGIWQKSSSVLPRSLHLLARCKFLARSSPGLRKVGFSPRLK